MNHLFWNQALKSHSEARHQR